MYTKTQIALTVPFEESGWTSDNVHDALLEVYNASSKSRFALHLIFNGLPSNNDIITYNNLIPNTDIILPFSCYLREVVFSNSKSNASARFKFYKNTTDSSDLFYTWDISSSKNSVLTGLSQSFSINDKIIIVFNDVGTNPSDVAIILYFSFN